MKYPWFKRWGWFHLPVSAPGIIATLLALGFCAQAFVAIDRHSHSVTDTLENVFPYLGISFLLVDWLAGRTSRGIEHSPDRPIDRDAALSFEGRAGARDARP